MTASIREEETELRLNKFLAEAGIAARRKADELIISGAVTVNGRTVTELGLKVRPAQDRVAVHGREIHIDSQLVYILLNKPKDCITSTSDEKGRTTVLDLVPSHRRLYPIGRLDRNTTGVLLLTNDGDLAYRLTHPRFHQPRVYRVEISTQLKSRDLAELRSGVDIEDGRTSPCEAMVIDPPHGLIVGIVLHEGRNRQVRRMFEALGYDVRKLERVEFAGLDTRGLSRGQWRYLAEHEVGRLKKIASTAPAPGARSRRGKQEEE